MDPDTAGNGESHVPTAQYHSGRHGRVAHAPAWCGAVSNGLGLLRNTGNVGLLCSRDTSALSARDSTRTVLRCRPHSGARIRASLSRDTTAVARPWGGFKSRV